jgi:peptidoglycan/xylan/chitin deacetylase (PgdA/CDA1 family)
MISRYDPSVLGRLVARRLLVLCYHNVSASWISPYEDGARHFERQLRAVRSAGHVVPLGPAARSLTAGEGLPARAVAISFDDGYRDNLEVAAPILERLGLPATFFLTPGVLSGEVRPWWEVLGQAWSDAPEPRPGAPLDGLCEELKLKSLEERDSAVATLVAELAPPRRHDPAQLFLDWDGARALVQRGFEIGSHTMSHPLLSRETPEEQHRQLSESKRQLDERLGIAVDMLAYPNGRAIDFDEHTEVAAAASGYTHAFTSIFGWNRPSTPRYRLRRVIVEPSDGMRGLGRPFRYAATDRLHTLRDRARADGGK